MGLFRLFLALSIAFQHSGMSWGLSGRRAVEVFFIISGFYMALILTTGKYVDYKTFLINRFLRLYPIYFLVAVSTIVLALFLNISPGPEYATYSKDFDLLSLFYVCFTNLTMFGQELSHFMGIQDGHLFGTSDFNKTSPHVWRFLVVPQAWSLSLELMFYCMAPAILWLKRETKLKTLLVCIFLSIACKVSLLLSDFPYDPWANRFFPSILSLFLLGALVYHFYESYLLEKFQKITKTTVMWCCGVAALIGSAYWIGLIPKTKSSLKRGLEQIPALQEYAHLIAEVVNATLPFIGYALLISFLFYCTSKNWLDRLIGELSYPLYVVHFMLISVLAEFMPRDHHLFAYGVVGISILASIALVKWVQNPIERYRMSRLKARKALSLEIPTSEGLPKNFAKAS